MALLADEIGRLRDDNQRLFVENDLLKQKVETIEAETIDRMLTEEITRLEAGMEDLLSI